MFASVEDEFKTRGKSAYDDDPEHGGHDAHGQQKGQGRSNSTDRERLVP